MTKDKIKDILDTLDTIQEQLLALPEDMLLNIDPRDNESLDNGVAFIKTFNKNLTQFSFSATQLAEQIKTYLKINPEEEEVEQENSNRQKRDRIIKELDKTSPHSLEEDFTYKRPFGFVLGDTAMKGLKTWKNLYIHVLNIYRKKEPDSFLKLHLNERFISSRGNPLFSKTGKELRVAEKLADDFYLEINMSANMIRNAIRDVLEYFGDKPMEMKVYLREDRDVRDGTEGHDKKRLN
jgi:hypothetical protein